MVPLTEDFLTIDYIAEKQYPLIFVTSGKLGSHQPHLAELRSHQNRGIALDTVLYEPLSHGRGQDYPGRHDEIHQAVFVQALSRNKV